MKLYLVRMTTSDQGTNGVLIADDLVLPTLEPPWRGNEKNISCIPAGTYEIHFTRTTRRHSGGYFSYWLKDVPDRVGILIHSGNWAGDRSKGLKSDSWGCILLGLRSGALAGQRAVVSSLPAMHKFHSKMAGQSAEIRIM